jgi:HEAT repeat protein
MGILDRKPNVKKLIEKKDVKGLVKALEYKKDADVRILSANALRQVGDPSVIPALAEVLQNDPNSMVKYTAAKAIIELGQYIQLGKETLAELIKLDEKTLAELILEGVKIDGMLLISNKQALVRIVGDKRKRWFVRTIAKQLLDEAEASLLIKQGQYKRAVGMGAVAVKAFSQAIRTCSPSILEGHVQRRDLAKWMEQIKDPHAVEPLLDLLDSAYDEELEAVIHLLDKLGDVRAIKPLEERFHRGWISINVEFASEVDSVINRLREKNKR